ncbi:hypothetical protein T484DRAFT_1807888, partial [Baffinella frigidus]
MENGQGDSVTHRSLRQPEERSPAALQISSSSSFSSPVLLQLSSSSPPALLQLSSSSPPALQLSSSSPPALLRLASTITKDDSYSFERNPRDVRTYSSSFRSRPYTTDYAEDYTVNPTEAELEGVAKSRAAARDTANEGLSCSWEPGDPTNIVRTVQHDPRLFSGMTKRSAVRWKDRSHRATTAGIKDFYDLGNSIRPDMAVAIERSPIKYSLFSASAIKATPSAIIAAPQ